MKPILFLCASDTLVKLLVPIGRLLLDQGYPVQYSTLMYSREKAEFCLATNIQAELYIGVAKPSSKWLNMFSALVIGNDWGDEIRSLIAFCNSLGIPTICVQESVIDFSGKKRRLQHASHVLLQGNVSMKMLSRFENSFITGNPRYDAIKMHSLPKVPNVFVNVNFTYGIEEDSREDWILAVLESCKYSDVRATLVQHPRDNADLSHYNTEHLMSNASVVHELIKNSSLVITRFSSLIHESICSGRPVIYFNPNKERIYYDFGADERVLAYTEDPKQLGRLVSSMLTDPPSKDEIDAYLKKHLFSQKNASKNCANVIVQIVNGKHPFSSDFGLHKAYLFQLKAISKDLYRFLF